MAVVVNKKNPYKLLSLFYQIYHHIVHYLLIHFALFSTFRAVRYFKICHGRTITKKNLKGIFSEWYFAFEKICTVDYYSEPTTSNSFKNNSTKNISIWFKSILIFYSWFLKKYGSINLISTLKILQNRGFFSLEYLENKRFDQTK